MAEVIRCPSCGGTALQKYGKTGAGLQKYRCMDPSCLRQFVHGSDHLVDHRVKDLVTRLLAEHVSPDAILKALTPNDDGKPPISRRWIYELRRRMKHDRQG